MTGPYRLFISFSGGETSAYMMQWLWHEFAWAYDEVRVVFANTGQENEATLAFVQRCSEHFDIPVTWVEAVTHHGRRLGCTHRVVDYRTASRDGAPFEGVIRKYGIPNRSYPHCTRELKLNPMTSYLRSIGWTPGSYDTAIGIRVDEVDRIAANRHKQRLLYPLVQYRPMTKPDINAFWRDQPFRLPLKGYEGNCAWCWKKSLRKHLTLLAERPHIYDFPQRMEREHGLAGHNIDGTPRVFFRESMSTADLKRLAAEGDFTPAEDDARRYPDDTLAGLPLDGGDGCSESCEVY